MKSYTAFLISVILSIHLYAASGDTDSIQVKYTFNPIVKIATKTAGAQRDLAASVYVIESADIEQAATNQVFELVGQQVPGLYVTEWGIMGFGAAGQSAGKLSVRGMGGGANTHVLILRNGRPDFMGLMGCTIADEFNAEGVERIEVIRGPGSFLYGTNATGGVINIVPKEMHQAGFETQIETGIGSYDTYQFALSHGGKIGNLDYYLTGSRNTTDGHRNDANAAYTGNHYTAHLGYSIDKNTTVDFNATWADLDLYDPGTVTDPESNDWYDINRSGGDLTLTHFSNLGETHVKFHGNFGHHHFYDGWESYDRLVGVMAYQTLIPWTGNTLIVGTDFKEYGGDAKEESADHPPYYITEYAPYLHGQQLLANRFLLTGGLRMEHHELYGWETLPKAGVVFHLFKTNAIRLSAAKGFRSPSIRELYFWRPKNEALTPDRLWNYELGLTQEIGRQFKIEAAVFRAEGSNLIQFSGPPPLWVNSGEYTHHGVECMTTWMPIPSLYLSSAWTFMDLEDEAYNIPKQKLSIHSRYQIGRITISGQLLSIHDWKGADFSKSDANPDIYDMDDYTVVHFSLHANLLYGLGVKVLFKNVFNETYQAMYGYPMPGRTFHGFLTYDF
ncbi:TonB-dependent receptor [bacterium]|nr:TonB-dependent receptor [bacterium]